MTKLEGYTTLVGRIFLSAIFIWSGWGKIADIGGTAAYIQSSGMPSQLAWPSAFFELIGGLFILLGFKTRVTAIVFAGFCIVTALLFHHNFAEPMQQVQFFKNLAITGGFLILASDPANPYSLDNLWDGKSPTE